MNCCSRFLASSSLSLSPLSLPISLCLSLSLPLALSLPPSTRWIHVRANRTRAKAPRLSLVCERKGFGVTGMLFIPFRSLSLSLSWAWGPVKVPGHISPPNSLIGLWGVKDAHIMLLVNKEDNLRTVSRIGGDNVPRVYKSCPFADASHRP